MTIRVVVLLVVQIQSKHCFRIKINHDGMYHILSKLPLFEMLLVILLSKVEQAINSMGLQRLKLVSQYQNDFDY